MNEEWKAIEGYEGIYEVSNLGRVRRLAGRDSRDHKIRGRILKPRFTTNGYLQVQLSYGGHKEHTVHRLVAEAFCQKRDNCFEVNHINEVKTDNRAENLEWVTRSENQNHATLPKRMSETLSKVRYGAKPVQQIDLSTGEVIAEFPSLQAADRATGIHMQNIGRVCRGAAKQTGGYGWKHISSD